MHPFERDTYIFHRQFLKLLGGAFRVYDENGQLLLFSEQKAFRLKEDIRVYTDEAKINQVLAIHTEQILDLSPTFEVTDVSSNNRVGYLKRKGWKSILKDEWEICDASGVLIGHVEEDSPLLAALRRFLTNLIPQKYSFALNGQSVGLFSQNFNPFTYRAVMDLTADRDHKLDRRLAVAIGILLMAIEGKED